MFVRAKYKDPAGKKHRDPPNNHSPQVHERAASVPSLPVFPGSRSGQYVNPLQTQLAPPTTYPLPLHHPSGIAYPPWQTPPATLCPPPLPVRSSARGPTQWVVEAPLPAVPTDDLRKGIDGEQRCLNRLPDLICSKLDSVLSSIDGETFSGDEKEFGECFLSLIFLKKRSYMRWSVEITWVVLAKPLIFCHPLLLIIMSRYLRASSATGWMGKCNP